MGCVCSSLNYHYLFLAPPNFGKPMEDRRVRPRLFSKFLSRSSHHPPLLNILYAGLPGSSRIRDLPRADARIVRFVRRHSRAKELFVLFGVLCTDRIVRFVRQKIGRKRFVRFARGVRRLSREGASAPAGRSPMRRETRIAARIPPDLSSQGTEPCFIGAIVRPIPRW